MKINLFDRVILSRDLPETSLRRGDVGTVVEIYDDGAGFEIEFFALDGETISVETVPAEFVRPVSGNMISHGRELVA